jgi:RNA-directed DNA polymerase
MQLELFLDSEKHTLTEGIFITYYACRKNKRNTLNAFRFEKHFEHNLFALQDEILNGRYTPGRSIAFIVENL